MKKEIYIDSDGQELLKTIWSDGDIWYTNRQDNWHRLNGPAIIYQNGIEFWYKDGEYHRLDGPTCVFEDGTEYWYKDGKLHRLDGPAYIVPNGKEEYYLEGEKVSKKEIDLLWLRKQVGK